MLNLFNFKNSHKKARYGFKSLFLYGIFSVLLVLSLALTGAGCNKDVSDGNTTTAASVAYPLTVTDDLGRTITIEEEPQRIVSLAPSNTEILFDLGLGDKVVGDTLYCDYPEAALNVEKVGGYSDVDIEKVVSLAPDLILAEDIHKSDVIPALENLGYTVYALVPHNLDEIMASVTTIGMLTGATEEAEAIVDDMQTRINFIVEKAAGLPDAQKPSVLYVIWQEPIMSSGVDTPIYEMITKAGGISIVQDDTGFPTLSLESVIDADPDVIICNVDYSYEGGDAPLVFMQAESRLESVSARKSGRVYGINASLTNRPVPRIIDGFEWMAAMIHPELFPELVEKYMGEAASVS